MMAVENVQEFRSVCAWNVCFCAQFGSVCIPAYKWPKWPDQRNLPDQGPSNGAVIFYDAGFWAKVRSCLLSQVSKILRQLTGQITAHNHSSKIRNTHLRLFHRDQGPHTVILHTKILQVIKN